jgi:hypothetical protein
MRRRCRATKGFERGERGEGQVLVYVRLTGPSDVDGERKEDRRVERAVLERSEGNPSPSKCFNLSHKSEGELALARVEDIQTKIM